MKQNFVGFSKYSLDVQANLCVTVSDAQNYSGQATYNTAHYSQL